MLGVRCAVSPGFLIKQDLHRAAHPCKKPLSLPAFSSMVARRGCIWDYSFIMLNTGNKQILVQVCAA